MAENVAHKNIPNMLSQISNQVSKEGLNIEHMVNGSRNNVAYTIIDVEGEEKDREIFNGVHNVILEGFDAVKDLIREIEIGLWDNYLFYDYESFTNIRAQHNLANVVQNMIMMNQLQL